MKRLSLVVTTAAILASAIMSAAPAKAAQFTGRQFIDFSGTKNTFRNHEENKRGGKVLEGTFTEGQIITGDEWLNQGLQISVDTGEKDDNAPDSQRLTLHSTDASISKGEDNDLFTGSQWGTQDYTGNALIIQETWRGGNRRNTTTKNGQTVYEKADDDLKGGTITFDFLSADNLYIYEDLNIGLLDIDGSESATITVYYKDKYGERRTAQQTLEDIDLFNENNPDTEDSNYSNITLLSNEKGNNSLWNFNFDLNQTVDGTYLKRRNWSIDKVEVEYSGSGGVAYLDYKRKEKEGYGEVEVPEPGSVMALLALGAFGGGSILKRKKHSV